MQRDWTSKPIAPDVAGSHVQLTHATAERSMIQRWEAETMREQPYNTIAAFELREVESAYDGKVDAWIEGSTTGYLYPQGIDGRKRSRAQTI